ncbi:RND transporter, partial [Cellulomonas septica]|nr:RND transporter [Cellulomonas septica]
MAELLYRLGRASARHARAVVAGWFAVLVAVGVAFVAFGGTLASAFTIPDTPTAEVTDQLQRELPSAAGGTGTVVISTEDGSAFTDEQKAAIVDRVDTARDVDGVRDVVDPFATQADLEEQRQQLDDGRAQLEQGRAQLDAFMSWEGHNYEDAIILSQRLVQDDVLSSIHIEEHEVDARDT